MKWLNRKEIRNQDIIIAICGSFIMGFLFTLLIFDMIRPGSIENLLLIGIGLLVIAIVEFGMENKSKQKEKYL